MTVIDRLSPASPYKQVNTCTKTLTATYYSPASSSKAPLSAHSSPFKSPSIPSQADQVFKEIFSDVPSPTRDRVYRKIRQKQRTMGAFSSEIVPQSQAFPQVMVTRDEIHRMGAQVGAGAYGEVFASKAMTLVRKEGFSPSRPKAMVLKRGRNSKHSAEEEARKLKKVLTPQSKSSKYIDRYQGVYRTSLGMPVSVHERFDRTLDGVKFEHLPMPVSHILPRLRGAMEGLASIHRGGAVHRDIKGPNILVMDGISMRPGALTDFGLLMEKKQTEHRTTGTVPYLAPFIFKDFEGQIQRRGVQTPAADIFAFGRTLQVDVLANMLKKIGKEKGVDVADFMQEILPKKIEGSIDELRSLGEKHPHLAFYNKGAPDKPDSVYLFSTAEHGYQKILELLARFESHFSTSEIQAFKELALITRDLQQIDPDKLPTAEQVLKSLKEIEMNSMSAPTTPQKSRVRKRCLLGEVDSKNHFPSALVVKDVDLSGPLLRIDSQFLGAKRLKSSP